MRQVQDSAMMDQCQIMRYSETFDAAHFPVPAWTAEPAIACGLEMANGKRQRKAELTAIAWDARIRLPIGTTLDVRDRIKLIKKYGETVTAITYELMSPASQGPSGLVAQLRKFDPGVQ